jgi:hypothetical protein
MGGVEGEGGAVVTAAMALGRATRRLLDSAGGGDPGAEAFDHYMECLGALMRAYMDAGFEAGRKG